MHSERLGWVSSYALFPSSRQFIATFWKIVIMNLQIYCVYYVTHAPLEIGLLCSTQPIYNDTLQAWREHQEILGH